MPSTAQGQRIRYRIAAETLLIAEEKWILESLKKIKTQRNCLQIERLQLESMKAKMKSSVKGSCAGESILPTTTADTALSTSLPIASTSMVNLMQNQGKAISSRVIECENNMFDVEAFCNEQALNLAVTNPVFSNNLNANFNMEENEEEEEEELDEDVPVDMDMLMSGANLD